MFCNDGFTIINRRHHCRNCGKVVCGSCSPHKRLITHIKKNKPVRVCLFCYDYIGLNEKDSSQMIQPSSSPSSSLHINGAHRSHLDILNSIIGERKRTLSFGSFSDGSSHFESNSTQPYNLTLNNSSNGGSSSSGSNININSNYNNIPNSSAGLSNKEHYSTFRKLKNKISKDSSSSSSSISVAKEKERDFSRSQSDLSLAGGNGGATPTTNNGRPPLIVRGGIPLPTTLSHGNLRPMLPINSVVLKPSNASSSSNSDQPKFQSPEFPQSKLSKLSPQSSSNNLNLITKPNKPPLSTPTPTTPPPHHPLPPTPPQHPLPLTPQPHQPPQHSLPSIPQSNTQTQHPLITQNKKTTRSASQPPLPDQISSSSLQVSPPNTTPLGKSAPILPPSRRIPPPPPPPNQPRNSLENNSSPTSTEQQPLVNSHTESINTSVSTANSKPLTQPRSIPSPTIQSINQLRTTNSNSIINDIGNQLQELEINTPTKLVGTTIPQKPAAPFRKRSSTTSPEVNAIIQQQPNLITKSSQKQPNVNNIQNNNNNEIPSIIKQPTAPIIKKRPLPQIPNQS
ncbi:hypothetical protein RB653_002076 [Dictyostelium firmibasis]|uniref:FYVE-type domain-containing protein n=1 Tax=Dictyostelium firmibasis TaxID=79012 RepID=A0AAN7TWU9_9MYCE